MRIGIWSVILFLLIWWQMPAFVCAASGADFSPDYSEIEESLSGYELSFEETVEDFIGGEEDGFIKRIVNTLLREIKEELSGKKQLLQQIFGLGAASAVFSLIAGSFRSGQAAQTGFYICSLMMITTLAGCFLGVYTVVETTIRGILDFMQALIPAYVTVLALGGGSLTSTAFYQGTLLLISIADEILIRLFLPMLPIYIALLLVGNVTGEQSFSKVAGLLKSIVTVGLKVMLWVVIGFGGLKSLIVPAADALKRSALTKAASAIPGIGGILEGVSQTVLGAAALLKNAVGAAGVVAICVICAVPVVQVLANIIVLKIGGAVVEPIADKRFGQAITACEGACSLLLNVLLTAAGMFLLTIMIAATAFKGG